MLTAADGSYRRYVVWALRDAKDDAAIAALEGSAPTARKTQQFAIAAVLSGNPTARSIAALHRVASKTGLFLRLVATAATLKFRLSVWPWSARLAVLCLVPALGVLLYHGTMIIRNPAWSEIVSLRRPLTNEVQKARIVNFLVDAYPGEFAPQLRELFEERRTRAVDPFLGALVRGLVTINDLPVQEPPIPDSIRIDAPLRAKLVAQIPRFDSLLRQSDSVRITSTEDRKKDSLEVAMSIEVLRAMARSSDTVLASRAVRALVKFANEDSARTETDALEESLGTARDRQQHVHAIPPNARQPAQEPCEQQGSREEPRVRTVLRHGQRPDPSNGAAGECDRGHAARRRGAREAARDAERARGDRAGALRAEGGVERRDVGVRMRRNNEQHLQRKSRAFKAIAENSGSEDGYRDLYSHYTTATQYVQATDTFELLKRMYPKSIWPRKILSEIDHESRSIKENGAFQRAYDEMIELRKLDAFKSARNYGARRLRANRV